MKTESEVERKFKEICQGLGWPCIKLQTTSVSGIPDRMVLLGKGRVAYVELKKETGKLSRIQKHVIAKLRAQGYCCLVGSDPIGLAYSLAFNFMELDLWLKSGPPEAIKRQPSDLLSGCW